MDKCKKCGKELLENENKVCQRCKNIRSENMKKQAKLAIAVSTTLAITGNKLLKVLKNNGPKVGKSVLKSVKNNGPKVGKSVLKSVKENGPQLLKDIAINLMKK